MTSLKVQFLIFLITLSSHAQSKPEQQADAKKETSSLNQSGRGDAELEGLHKQVRENPYSAEAHFNLGLKFLSADSPVEYKRAIDNAVLAIAEFKQAVVLKPDYAEAYLYMGRACFRASIFRKEEFYEQARIAFLQATRLNPDYVEAYSGLGWAYLLTNRRELAVNAFNKAIRINPDFADAYDGLGTIYRGMGKNVEAVAALKKAAEHSPKGYKGFMILSNLQSLYEELGRYAEAIEIAEKAVTYQPDPFSYFGLGELYLKVDRPDDAVAAYKMGVSLRSGMQGPSAATNADTVTVQFPQLLDTSSMRNMIGGQRLGYLYVRLGRYQEAIEPCQQEIRDNSKNQEAYRVLKDAYLKLGLKKEAVDTYRQMAEAFPDEPEAQFELGTLYLEVGDKAGALAAQRKLVEMAERTKKAGAESDSERYAKQLLKTINQ